MRHARRFRRPAPPPHSRHGRNHRRRTGRRHARLQGRRVLHRRTACRRAAGVGTGPPRGRSGRRHRQPGHGRRHVAAPRRPRPGRARRPDPCRTRDHPRDRHHGGDGLFPESCPALGQTRGAGWRDAPRHRHQRRRPDEPLQRRRRGGMSRDAAPRRARGRQRRNPFCPRGRQDQHHPGRHVPRHAPRPRRPGQQRPVPPLRPADAPPHRAERVFRRRAHCTAAGGHRLCARRHGPRAHRRGGPRRSPRPRARRRRRRQPWRGRAARRRGRRAPRPRRRPQLAHRRRCGGAQHRDRRRRPRLHRRRRT